MANGRKNPYAEWVRKRAELDGMPRSLKLANTGSTCGCSAFDYRYWDAPGMNLGTAPQSLYYDFEMLRKYGDHLAAGATVFLSIEHFKFLVDNYEDLSRDYKYYFLLDPRQIFGYSRRTHALLKFFPDMVKKGSFRRHAKRALKRILPFRGKRSAPKPPARPIAEEGSPEERDARYAKSFMDGWYRQFGWEEDDSHLSEALRGTVSLNLGRLNEMLEYCVSHGWTPIVTVMPMSASIAENLPKDILEECLWEPLRAVRAAGHRVLDLYHDERFQSYALYENALAMNDAGRALFNREAREYLMRSDGDEVNP